MYKRFAAFTAMSIFVPAEAYATPGLAGEVYGAEIEKGEAEFEAIYGRLDGGAIEGEDVLKLEGSYGVTDRLRLGVIGEIEHGPASPRKFNALGFEAIYELGRLGNFAFAAYGEYEIGLTGADKIETKLLVQNKAGFADFRLNLIAEKSLEAGHPVEFEYAASVDVPAFGEVRLGAVAFGELGTFDRFLPRAEHYLGPVAKVEIEGLGPELELEAGYLFAIGNAQDGTHGQFRLAAGIAF